MTNDSETVREVCFEVETLTDITLKEGGVFFPREVSAHFERFLSAYEREMEAKDAEIARLKEKSCEYALPNHGCTAEDKHFHKTVELERKVALLERALKPVMNCLHYYVSKATKAMVTYDEGNEEVLGELFDKDGATVITESEINNIFKAVIEAQRIILEAWDDKNYFWKGENHD